MMGPRSIAQPSPINRSTTDSDASRPNGVGLLRRSFTSRRHFSTAVSPRSAPAVLYLRPPSRVVSAFTNADDSNPNDFIAYVENTRYSTQRGPLVALWQLSNCPINLPPYIHTCVRPTRKSFRGLITYF